MAWRSCLSAAGCTAAGAEVNRHAALRYRAASMTPARRFRFGVELVHPFDGSSWLDTVREIEALGYSTLVVPDHFDQGLGPLSAMAAGAAVTTTLNFAPLVLDTDYRHPVVVARELESIDLLSEGRLEVGLGAGWKRKDYESSGIIMDPPKVRVDRMIEHMKVLKGLFSEGPFSFTGEHYTISELDGTPKPHRAGGPPFIIGGGAPRVLRFAGANADIVGVIASVHSGEVDVAAAQDTLPERMDQKFAWVREGAETVNAQLFDELEINSYLSLASVTEQGHELAAQLAPG